MLCESFFIFDLRNKNHKVYIFLILRKNMPELSMRTYEIIKDNIADFLYRSYPAEISTYKVAISIGRGRRIVLRALQDLAKLKVVKEVNKDKRGFPLVGERRKWKMAWTYVQALKKKGF